MLLSAPDMPGPGVAEPWEPLAGFEAGTAGLPGTGSWSGCAVPHVVVPVRPTDTEDIMPMIHIFAISRKYLIGFVPSCEPKLPFICFTYRNINPNSGLQDIICLEH